MKKQQEEVLLAAFRKATENEKKMIVAIAQKCASRQIVAELKARLGHDQPSTAFSGGA